MATAELQLVDAKGAFNMEGLCAFAESVALKEAGTSYAVVAIVGPQSGGKSTFLNHLFKTKFKEMDEMEGRNQTTQGAWIGVADDGLSPLTLVMDLEGADGKERGEDDTLFERQGALFALAVADVVIYNMWCHDIGRVQASGTLLLKVIFEVMLRMKLTKRKKTFLFVIRDKTNTPEEKLKIDLLTGMERIWTTLRKPEEHEQTPLSEFFDVQVTLLPNFLYQPDQWKERVKELRGLFGELLIPNALEDGSRVPGDAFSLSTKELWYAIEGNKELDIPRHRFMVATVRCEQILMEKFERFQSDERWLSLKMQIDSGDVGKFGETTDALVKEYLDIFSSETAHYDKEVKTSKFDALRSKILADLQPVQKSVLKYYRKEAFRNFKRSLDTYFEFGSFCRGESLGTYLERNEEKMLVQFDNDAKFALSNQWNSEWKQYQSKKWKKFSDEIRNFVQDLRNEKLVEVQDKSKADLETAVAGCSKLLRDATRQTWPGISTLLKIETEKAIANWEEAVSYLDPTQGEKQNFYELLREYGRGIVKQKTQTEANHAPDLMLEKFKWKLDFAANDVPRQYVGDEGSKIPMDIIVSEANDSSVKVLKVLAAVRLDEEMGFDEIDEALNALLDAPPKTTFEKFKGTFSWSNKGLTSEDEREKVLSTVLSMNRWEHVSDDNTLLTPSKCKELWQSFQLQNKVHIQNAMNAQKAAATNFHYALMRHTVGAYLIGKGMDVVGAVGFGRRRPPPYYF